MAKPAAVAMPEPEEPPDDAELEGGRMPFLSHLAELRDRVRNAAIFFMLAFVVCWYFADEIFVWLKEPPKSRYTVESYHRSDTLHIWGEFLPRIKRMREAYDTDEWPAKPSGLCRAWCPCTGCEHNGRRG